MITGILEVIDDLYVRVFLDPLPATVGGTPLLLDRASFPEGIQVGQTVTVRPGRNGLHCFVG